ncbi:hypothetical protein ACIGB6_20360 [Paeniglutamicibacter gangotriensis]|uniref:Uncharacterized protein n=1 Tax=Paeniglutamicibacter gangotriensis Lz1y TaxID=1276920 RepID=M7N9P8_9MICC|nr:hypothetical protein [Paeniglutamicibacter gangotriensis]EMQ98519.1 hypothetical protein ADIAG_01947 [Paeniglutamicibacter gangotriensis Lz1y]
MKKPDFLYLRYGINDLTKNISVTLALGVLLVLSGFLMDRRLYLRDGQLVESRDLGPWSRQRSAEREEELLGWLGGMGF